MIKIKAGSSLNILKQIVIWLFATLLSSVSVAETVTWEASLVTSSGSRKVIDQGIKTYSPEKDIKIHEQKHADDGSVSWSKGLVLNDSFAISVEVYREASIDGFGVVVYKRGDKNGFSWEWFDREKGESFIKRQGSGHVLVTLKKDSKTEEIQSVEFLDDVTLRYLDDMSKPPGTHTHEIIIRKGSVLKVSAP